MKIKQYVIFVIISSFVTSVSALQAADQYVGAWFWRANWDVGVLKTIRESERLSYPIFQAGLISNTPNPTLNMYGATYSYISDRWSLTYGGALGDSKYEYNQNFLNSFSSGYTLIPFQTNVYARRSDHDLTFTRRISDTGFSFFVGLKAQDYFYSLAGDTGIGIRNSSGYINPSVSNSSQYMYSKSAGFSGGFSYTLPLTDRLSSTVQLGGIFLKGSLESDTLLNFSSANTFNGIPGNEVNFAYIRNSYSQTHSLKGETLRITFDYKAEDNLILRLGYQGQQATIEDSKIGNSVTSIYNNNSNTGLSYPLQTNLLLLVRDALGGSFDKSKDTFHGVTFAFILKI
ncbi:MAG: hypothetical protein O9264_12020 [Leptospira sp.]|nr:hypothetical protein [Leptospira sp.]